MDTKVFDLISMVGPDSVREIARNLRIANTVEQEVAGTVLQRVCDLYEREFNFRLEREVVLDELTAIAQEENMGYD